MVEESCSSALRYMVAWQISTLLITGASSCLAQSGRNGVWDASSSSSSQSSSATSTSTGSTTPGAVQTGVAPNPRYSTALPGYGSKNRPAAYNARGYYQNRTQNSAAPPSKSTTGNAAASRAQFLDYNETLDGRKYTVHLPHSYNQSTPASVVIVFHGLGMNGTSVRGLSAMDLTAERNGFITVYPDAVGGRWNDGVQRETGVDDVAFVSAMLDEISRKFKVNNRRVYACGISNGGFFVQRLACELPNRIAAIGVVAATASDTVCSHCALHHGMPIVFFLGTDDPLLPREGETKELGKLGEALGLSDLGIKNINSTVAKFAGIMSAAEAPEFWAKNNGASAQAREEMMPDRDTRDGCRVKKETYGGSSEVVVYTIEGGGHSWPGGMGFVAQDIIGRTTNDINASDIMWQFFQSHYR